MNNPGPRPGAADHYLNPNPGRGSIRPGNSGVIRNDLPIPNNKKTFLIPCMDWIMGPINFSTIL
jgi:hypothetical protein